MYKEATCVTRKHACNLNMCIQFSLFVVVHRIWMFMNLSRAEDVCVCKRVSGVPL